MKNLKLALPIFFLAFAALIVSCGSGSGVSEDGPEYTSAYICPMHCEGSGSDKMGTCPDCEMDYEVNENYKKKEGEAENHDGHDHSGHDHGSHEGHNH